MIELSRRNIPWLSTKMSRNRLPKVNELNDWTSYGWIQWIKKTLVNPRNWYTLAASFCCIWTRKKYDQTNYSCIHIIALSVYPEQSKQASQKCSKANINVDVEINSNIIPRPNTCTQFDKYLSCDVKSPATHWLIDIMPNRSFFLCLLVLPHL